MPEKHTSTWQAQQDFALRAAEFAACVLADAADPDDEANREAIVDHSIVIIVGSGNTGAIGLMVAYHLAQWEAWVQVLTLTPLDEHEGNAATALDKLSEADVPLTWAEDGWELPPCDLLIDAMSDGIGQAPDVANDFGALRKLIELTNSSLAPILTVGMPSAVETDGMKTLAVQASHTILLDG